LTNEILAMADPKIILLVDDEPSAIEVLCKALKGLGDLRFATSGADALTVLRECHADLVLLDLSMPGIDGFATCIQIKAEHPDTPVIFVTAAHDMASEIRALEVGGIDFIQKPISPPVVRARVSAHLKLKEQSDLLRELSKRDPLTGVANRRALDEQVALEWRRGIRSGESLSLLMIDIDHFKKYNDHYGHLEGDNCLRKVAQAISTEATRADDVVARFGGEEFAVLLPSTNGEQAMTVANRICEAVRSLGIPHAPFAQSDSVTISIGVGSVVLQASADSPNPRQTKPLESGLRTARALFEMADRALYAAKQGGRNRVQLGGH
jgi:diguanylate cyclase (GGDEF)-like protein